MSSCDVFLGQYQFLGPATSQIKKTQAFFYRRSYVAQAGLELTEDDLEVVILPSLRIRLEGSLHKYGPSPLFSSELMFTPGHGEPTDCQWTSRLLSCN